MIKQYFSNRLIIIDEVHNIRSDEDNKNKVASKMLFQIVEHADNIRLLLLSATPMYNSFKEIIWITNLLNLNDGRSRISAKDVFDNEGNFLESLDNKKENGRDLLKRKLNGYVSYVRGENPYTFPFRIYPNTFDNTKTFSLENKKPTIQLNDGKQIEKEKELKLIQPYLSNIIDYQEKIYSKIIKEIQTKDEDKKVEKFGYETLQIPIQALNMVYPSDDLNTGKQGLLEIMTSTEKINSSDPYKLNYKERTIKNYGRIFSESKILKYSAKISNICNIIRRSTGTVLIYSQYIDSGLILQVPPIIQIDAIQLKNKNEIKKETKFFPAKYMMITGKKNLSPNNTEDLAYFNDASNNYGEKIKVILISRAGAEGLDFKNIRQIHVMDPWYNMNRIEQIIGRGVRNLSHCGLPFEERNVEIYLHASLIDVSEN